MNAIEQSAELPPHMQHPDIWELSREGATPGMVINYLDWVRDDTDRMASFRDAIFEHALGRFVVIAGAEFDGSGMMSRQLEIGMYADGLEGRDDKHNHLYAGRAFVVGASEKCGFRSDYYYAVPPDTPTLSGVDFDEHLLVANGLVHNDQAELPPEYRIHKIGTSRLQWVGQSTLGLFGWHSYNTTLVHRVQPEGSMVLSFIEKSERRDPSLTSPAGLRFQGFDDDQVRQVEDFKLTQAGAGRSFLGITPIYIEADPDATVEDLSSAMQNKTTELSDGERDNVVDALFVARDEIADWSRRLAA